VAAGTVYCGNRITQGSVLYIAVERGAVVRRRVQAWCRHHGETDIPLAVVSEMIDLRTGRIHTDRIIATAQAFAEAGGIPVVWIIIDTLNRALAGGDENSSKDMGAVIAAVDRIQRATGAHCSLIHHVPVDRTDRMRGHGSVLGAVDLTVRITRDNKIVMVEADKANDLVEKPRFAFRFENSPVTGKLSPQRRFSSPATCRYSPAAPSPVPSRGPNRYCAMQSSRRWTPADEISMSGAVRVSAPPLRDRCASNSQNAT
jgi:hypothetical protein